MANHRIIYRIMENGKVVASVFSDATETALADACHMAQVLKNKRPDSRIYVARRTSTIHICKRPINPGEPRSTMMYSVGNLRA